MTKNPDEGPLRDYCARAGRVVGIVFIDKLLCVMGQKTYELVARTEGGRVRLIGSVVREQREAFMGEIERLSDDYEHCRDKMECLLRMSAVYGQFGNFLLQCGFRVEAFACYCEAAGACLSGPDSHWLERGRGFTVYRRLRERFFEMYDLCRRMVAETPELGDTYHNMLLENDRRSIADD